MKLFKEEEPYLPTKFQPTSRIQTSAKISEILNSRNSSKLPAFSKVITSIQLNEHDPGSRRHMFQAQPLSKWVSKWGFGFRSQICK